ncbi:PepSY domain-containing protein [Ruminococcus sp.]|uniref:PepSY domain-containing protein n=1 Tax=Ruminococcus sp. TaxID=41978 RepID=UPI003AB451AA
MKKSKEEKIMKLKRRVSITRVGLLLLLAASIMASAYADAVPLPEALSAFTSDDLSMNEAIQIAQSVACQKRNISVTDIADETIKASFVLLDNGQTAWVVTLFDDAFQDPTDISILISSPDGAILDVQTTNIGYFKTIRDRWQEKMGDADTWSLEMKALFNRLYTVHDDFAVPDDTMIQQEQAASIALREIPDDLSVDQILYSFSFNSSAEETREQYVWRITIVSEGKKRYQVNLSAIDGSILDVFSLDEGLGRIKNGYGNDSDRAGFNLEVAAG